MNFDILFENIIADKQIITESFIGEWWITDTGDAIFADGDVGDMNHAAHIIELLASEILERLGVNAFDQVGNLSEHEDEIKQALNLDEEQAEIYDNDPAAYILNVMKNDNPYPTYQQLEDALFIAYGSSSKDPRAYAMKYMGFKRMAGRDIQTQNLTSDDLKIISRGINSAYGDELNDRYSDDETEQPTFGIEVMSTRQWYQDIPLDVIDEGDPAKIAVGRR